MADLDTSQAEAHPTAEEVMDVIKVVQDPELQMSIVDLGLVYGVDIDEEGMVTVQMTLTSPACPVGPMLQGQIYHTLNQMEGVEGRRGKPRLGSAVGPEDHGLRGRQDDAGNLVATPPR